MHTKVEVRVAHLLGMHSFDDFRVNGLDVKTALITYIHIKKIKSRPRRKKLDPKSSKKTWVHGRVGRC